ncbi:type II secretion system F family protein [Cellulomonas sp. KRMCY2]|uniref:type II secretion system F family protein n=1 Tax=Cellulomonas sp. KRMCY2 TaxID=1304865 RepID=UPI0004AE1F98|nr:type II secretion system F family protein [Cellulomonas sp. KRMCY2]
MRAHRGGAERDRIAAGRVALRRAAAAPPTSFAAAVTTVSGALRSGASPAAAWERGLGVRTVAGVPVWPDLVAHCPDDPASARAVLAAARLAVEVGAAPAEVLDRVVGSLAREAEAAAQRRAALAGPQATARVLAWLPALGLALGFLLGANPAQVLLDGGRGTALLLLGTGLTVLGRRWTARHVRAAAAAGRER